MKIIVSEYYATGEGQTISILITSAYPKYDRDYISKPKYNLETGEYDPGELKYTHEEIAKIEFINLFGTYFAQWAEILTLEQLLQKYEKCVPEMVINILKSKPANLNWYSQIHVNFS